MKLLQTTLISVARYPVTPLTTQRQEMSQNSDTYMYHFPATTASMISPPIPDFENENNFAASEDNVL